MQTFATKAATISIALSTLLCACKKDDPQADYMSADIDGTSYKPQSLSAYFASNSNKGNLIIKSNTDNGETLQLIINGYKGPGTYTFLSDSMGKRALCTYSRMIDNGTIYTYTTEDRADNGSISISRLEGAKVEGSFSFRAYNAVKDTYVNVSNGKFRANF